MTREIGTNQKKRKFGLLMKSLTSKCNLIRYQSFTRSNFNTARRHPRKREMMTEHKTQRYTRRWFGWRLLLIPLVTVGGLAALSMTASAPSNLGAANGRLAKCPDKPNCVSTQAENEAQAMEAISFIGSAADQNRKIKRIVAEKFSRARLVSESEYYLHFEFKSLVFRFVDDVEFLVDDASSLIQFRSSSRVGHSDMGANRKRMTEFVKLMSQ